MISVRYLLLCCAVMVGLASCKSESVTGPDNHRNEEITGTLIGSVYSLSKESVVPLAGARIEVDSIHFAYTDSLGVYHLTLPTSRNHTVRITKEGHGEMKVFNVPFAAPGKAMFGADIVLGQIPSYRPVDLTLQRIDSLNDRYTSINAKQKLIAPEAQLGNATIINLYLSDPTQTPSAKPVQRFVSHTPGTFKDREGILRSASLISHLELIYSGAFELNQQLYATIQIANMATHPLVGRYQDPLTGEWHYTAVGPESEPIRFILD